jgi:hypothetical protein
MDLFNQLSSGLEEPKAAEPLPSAFNFMTMASEPKAEDVQRQVSAQS